MRRRSGFQDRQTAGAELAVAVAEAGPTDPVVLGLARGGVVVAAPIADRLEAPLDVLVVRKLGLPFQPELAMGAIAEGGSQWINHSVISAARVAPEQFEQVREREQLELDSRVRRYRGGRDRVDVHGCTAILVDDGLATGATARAAVAAVRDIAGAVWFAVPVGAPDTVAVLSALVDNMVCLLQPTQMRAVGVWYSDFGQVTDDEVLSVLERRSPS